MTSKQRAIGCGVGLLAVCGFLAALWYMLIPPARVITTSDSLDGKYRCSVVWKEPAFMAPGPQMYEFHLLDRASSADLPGKFFTRDNDREILSDLLITWSGDEVNIRAKEGPTRLWVGGVKEGRQDWHEQEIPR